MIVVGLEYPVLAIMVSVAFLVVIFASLFLYLHVISELEKVPVLNGDVEVYTVACNFTLCTRLVLAISNERGDPAELVQVRIYTDKGVLTINFSSTIVVNGNEGAVQNLAIYGLVNGKTILPGATARVVIDVSRAHFITGKTYQVAVFFDKGILILPFNVK